MAAVAFARPEPTSAQLIVEAQAPIPTKHGSFRCLVFRHASDFSREHVAFVVGDVRGDDVLVRVHCECMTSEVFGSLQCDCAAQLDAALAAIAQRGRGVLVYLRQGGRGIGLANEMLGLPDDARHYDAAAALLEHLGTRSTLVTNTVAVCTKPRAERHELSVKHRAKREPQGDR